MDTGTDSVGVVEHEVTLFLRRVESARTEDATLDRSAYLILGQLAAAGPLGIGALAQTFQLDISTASRQTAALEAKGLAERLPDPADGRVSLLRITPRGWAQFKATRDTRHALFAELLADWPEEDRRRFGAYLARFNESVIRRRRRIAAHAPPRRMTSNAQAIGYNAAVPHSPSTRAADS